MSQVTNPLISIITPAYNSAEFITNTIRSVQQQSFTNWEHIIVDDSSDDNTFSIIKSFAKEDSRIIPVRNKENSGAAVTRNKGLELAKGRFIAFLDSDDLWYPEKLDRQLKFMLENQIPISFASYDLISNDGKKLNKVIKSVKQIDYTGYMKDTIIGMSSTMIDTSIVNKPFRFVNIRTRQDCYLWITLLKRGHLAYGMPDVLSAYRVRKGSISSNKIKAAKRVWYLYYNLENLGFLRSLYFFGFYIYNAVKKRIIA